jgi:RHS repeat-associated protein
VQLTFYPVRATGIKIVIQGSNASNENSVLTEFKIYTSDVVTKYYYAGGQRIAMRKSGVVYYLHGDHLGSTSLTTNANSTEVARQLYYPYGEVRWSSGTLPTDYTFTGQRNESSFNLMDYNARYYDPYLNRFISPDTIIPDPANPQSLNRYSYARNNPLNRVDPTGHQDIPPDIAQLMQQAIAYFQELGWTVVGDPSTISPYANGPDLVFIAENGLRTLAVELKDVTGSVNLGTLGKSRYGDYGGSIDRLARSTKRLYDSSNEQLSLFST